MTDVPPQNPQYPQYPSYPGDAPQSPPPAPPGGAYPPPPPGYGQPQQPGAFVPYASWGSRVGAYLLDSAIVTAIFIIPFIVGMIIALADVETYTTRNPITGEETTEITGDANPVGVLIVLLALVIGLGFGIWNYVIRQGRTGQSIGKKIVGIKVVRLLDGQVLGGGTMFLRVIMLSLLSSFTCYINLLWPLWDDKKQALHDKVVGSVVLQAS